jgi:FG-GAP-like repeat
MMTDNGTIVAEQSFLGSDGNILRTGNKDWQVIGLVDMDGDRTLDVVWHNAKSDEVGFWFMNADGKTVNRYDYLRQGDQQVFKTGNSQWQVADVADFDGDGDADLLFRLPELNQTAIVRLQGTAMVDQQYITANADASLTIRGVGDANGDAIADIYWQTPNQTQVVVQPLKFQQNRWLTDDFVTIASNAPLQGIGDLDLDGVDDLLLRDRASNGLLLTIVDPIGSRPLGNLQNQGVQFTFDAVDWQIEQMDEFGELA